MDIVLGITDAADLLPSISALDGSPFTKLTLALGALGFGREVLGRQWIFSSILFGLGREGAPQDRPGPEDKVTFSAQQPGCLILLGSSVCGGGQPSSGIYPEHTTWTQ